MATELTDPQTDRLAMTPEGQVFEISKAVTFEAAHRLPGRGKDDTYGQVHGHSFRLEASVCGTVQPGKLWVEDIAVLTAALTEVAQLLDHKMLNDVPGLDVPTLENIALWAAERLKTTIPGLASVTVARPSLNEACTLRL
ncbi:MAG: 6-carboxytetrahydropterin synthase [Pseudomonadota bacterium]